MSETERFLKEMSRKIKAARKNAGLSQADVAQALGLTSQGYGYYETGSRAIGVEYLLLMPKILGVPITDLLPDSVVTEHDRARAADPRLQEITQAWPDLPEFLRDGLASMVRDARKQFKR